MRRTLLFTPIAPLLAGCAALHDYAVAPGTTRDGVVARLGQPQAVYRLSGGGERLQYSRQPAGRTAWMVDLDAAGRVVSARQVLSEQSLRRIVPGQWTLDDVHRELGPPAWVDHVASWNGPVLNYRWRDTGYFDMLFHVYLDANNVVQRAHPAIQHVDAANDRS